MTQEHPITPPDYLVKEWSSMNWQEGSQAAFADAARWGADQELEACCELLTGESLFPKQSCGGWLRNRRRPKPPSLKERIATAIAHGDNSIALALLDQALPD